jgi:hypothetical protein
VIRIVSGACDLDVLVVSILNPPIDAFELVFELRMKGSERLLYFAILMIRGAG